MRGTAIAASAAGVLGVALLPVFASDYLVGFVFNMFLFLILAYGWNLLSGYSGYLSFGQISFFGVGAYTLAILVFRLHWPWPLGVLCSTGVAVVLAAPLGWLMLRLRGPYFALGMLGFVQVLFMVASAASSITGGGEGIYLPPEASLQPLYYAAAAMVAAGVATTWAIERSAFGLRLQAIREDELAAEAMGVNTTRNKLAAFVLSAVFPAVAGGLYAWRLSYIDPASAFPGQYEMQSILMTIFGGAGTIWGPLLGGVALSIMGEVIWARFAELHLFLFGSLIVLVLLFMPEGAIPLLRRYVARRKGQTPEPPSKKAVA
ncbi:MAG: branched-chain amino acid ABC transporter permease [Candidatus Methylomirabilales bacterium]